MYIWYIYPHLVDFYGINVRKIAQTWMVWVIQPLAPIFQGPTQRPSLTALPALLRLSRHDDATPGYTKPRHARQSCQRTKTYIGVSDGDPNPPNRIKCIPGCSQGEQYYFWNMFILMSKFVGKKNCNCVLGYGTFMHI